MPIFHCQMFFTQVKGGWSESWWKNEASAPVALAQVKLLANNRANMMSQPAIIDYVRVSNDAIQGDVRSDGTNVLGKYPAEVAGKQVNADLPWSGILCRFFATDIYRRNELLRGIPDLAFESGRWDTVLPNALVTAFDGYVTFLKAGNWLMRCLSKDEAGPFANQPHRVLSVSSLVDFPTIVNFITQDNHGLAVGDYVTLTGFRDHTGLTGRWPVSAVASVTQFSIKFKVAPTIAPFYNLKGQVRKILYTYVPVDTGTIIRAGERKVGRPFDLVRGRAPNRR